MILRLHERWNISKEMERQKDGGKESKRQETEALRDNGGETKR